MTTFSDFIDLIHTTRDKALLEDLLIGVTTPAERTTLAHRVEIIERLLKGQPQHHIAGDLRVGVSTVTRGARELELGHFKALRNKS